MRKIFFKTVENNTQFSYHPPLNLGQKIKTETTVFQQGPVSTPSEIFLNYGFSLSWLGLTIKFSLAEMLQHSVFIANWKLMRHYQITRSSY